MRLIDTSTGVLKHFANDNEVKYAILSHRWEDEEVSLQEFTSNVEKAKKGFVKIQNAREEALKMDLPYLWVDTCCIDKSSSAELSEAINSMYRWYQQADICFAYLSDVDSVEDMAASTWFTRGWTLQELIAPNAIKFYNKNWRSFGSKAGLQSRLSRITSIPIKILRGKKPTVCSIAQRMSWAAHRVTTRPEDMAYCLMGLFEVNMPMLYGEGLRAFTRLQEEIIKSSDDESIFVWSNGKPGYKGTLAPSPMCFQNCGNVTSTTSTAAPRQYSMTNVGLLISLPLLPWAMNTYLAILKCADVSGFKDLMPQYRQDASTSRIGIFVRSTGREGLYARIGFNNEDVCHIQLSKYNKDLTPVPLFLQRPTEEREDPPFLYGFLFQNITTTLFPSSGSTEQVPYVVSRQNPVVMEWSSGRYHDLRTWVSDIGDFKILSDTQPVIVVESPCGEQGVIAILCEDSTSPDCPERDASDAHHLVSVEFGFDFYFNPVCILRKMPTASQSPDRPPPRKQLSTSDLVDCNVIEHLIQKFGSLSADDAWEKEGIVAIRGHRGRGLAAEFKLLNIRINISEGWKDAFTKAWVVDITAMNLPHVLPDLPYR